MALKGGALGLTWDIPIHRNPEGLGACLHPSLQSPKALSF